MKLLTRTSLSQLWLSLFILVLTGGMLMLFLHFQVSAEIKEQLELQSAMVADEIAAGKTVNFPLVEISKDEAASNQPDVFKDTLLHDHLQEKAEGYFYLSKTHNIHGKNYRINVMTTHIGLDGYLKAVSYIFGTMAFLFIALGALMNYFISKKIWHPFLSNLQKLKRYSVSSQESLYLKQSTITEFKEMNAVLQELAAGARREYSALKEFTENASHEIQTPLSIIQSRLESISQLTRQPDVARFVVDAKQATHRLSKVNKGLLLLAKLENNAFPDKEMVDVEEIIDAQLSETADLYSNKGLKIIQEKKSRKVTANRFLVETMISNLLSNMLNHSPSNTAVYIVLKETTLSFYNEGRELKFDQSKLFSRFAKAADNYRGNGLGLSIVKRICLVNGWQIKYSYAEGKHGFEIAFLSH
ncbi:MAG: sensor histidine kinase [Sphingobacteriaceae bacterium]